MPVLATIVTPRTLAVVLWSGPRVCPSTYTYQPPIPAAIVEHQIPWEEPIQELEALCLL